MRLIDADELNKYPIRLDHYDKEHGNEHFVFGIESVLEYAEYLPTIDAVPVVRCEDCAISYWLCDEEFVCARTGVNVDPDDFCSYAEQKDGDGNG